MIPKLCTPTVTEFCLFVQGQKENEQILLEEVSCDKIHFPYFQTNFLFPHVYKSCKHLGTYQNLFGTKEKFQSLRRTGFSRCMCVWMCVLCWILEIVAYEVGDLCQFSHSISVLQVFNSKDFFQTSWQYMIKLKEINKNTHGSFLGDSLKYTRFVLFLSFI